VSQVDPAHVPPPAVPALPPLLPASVLRQVYVFAAWRRVPGLLTLTSKVRPLAL